MLIRLFSRRRGWIAAAFLGCLLSVRPAAATADTDTRIPLDGVAAYVNQRVITVGDVFDVMAPVAAQLQQRYRDVELRERMADAYQQALRNLVDRALILDAYERAPAPIPERLLQARIRDITFDQFGGDREAVWEKLTEEGMTLEEWHQALRERIIASAMQDHAVDNRLSVSPGEVQRFYEASIERYRSPAAVHLWVLVLRGATDPLRIELAGKLAARVREGAAFADVAREYSEGRQAADGGDWGWLPIAELRPELAGPARDLPIGAISDPVVMQDQIYLLKAAARRQERITPLAEVRDEIERELRQHEMDRLYRQWISRLESEAYVRILEIDF